MEHRHDLCFPWCCPFVEVFAGGAFLCWDVSELGTDMSARRQQWKRVVRVFWRADVDVEALTWLWGAQGLGLLM